MWSGEADDWLEQGVNHLLDHGWVLFHVRQQTGGTFGEDTHEDTVAVLGEPAT